mgnify:CR=1 FL=1
MKKQNKIINFATIDEIIQDAKQGKMFIIVDDEQRENEGDLVIPAQFADKEAINFMAKYGRGLICLALTEDRVRELKLPLMSPFNNSRHGTAFTLSIEAKEGVSTGISAADRAKTIADAIDETKGAEHICTPGHVFPLVARNGGVLTRAGHTEAAIDISRQAKLNTSGVICEIMNEDGTMARVPDLMNFAAKHDLKIATIADLISYRRKSENLVSKEITSKVTTKYGEFELSVYVSKTEYAEHLVLKYGELDYSRPVMVRMHSQNILADILGVKETKKEDNLTKSLEIITKNNGIIVMLRSPQKNRVSETLKSINGNISERPSGNIIRDYGIGAQILRDMGVREMRLITHSEKSIIGLESFGLKIIEYIKI